MKRLNEVHYNFIPDETKKGSLQSILDHYGEWIHLPSQKEFLKGKKVVAFKNGKKVADIGAKGYRDFHTIKAKDREEAEKAKKAYRARHGCDKDPRRGTPQFYSCEILWNE